MDSTLAGAAPRFEELESHRRELTGYCYRMLGSPFEAEDAVQDTLLRAWRAIDRFEGRSALRSWLYRIATNVCMDMLSGRQRRALPMDFGPASPPDVSHLNVRPESTWVEPMPHSMLSDADDPAEIAQARETMKLAFLAALQHLPPRQRAALILCEVLRWQASEVAELLETSTASINSALQRARTTLSQSGASLDGPAPELDAEQRALVARYVDAFERYDMTALTALIQEDATQSMPPYDMWLSGREDILTWWAGPGIDCAGSRLLPAAVVNGPVAFGQYRKSKTGPGHDPWALQIIEFGRSGVEQMTFFLDTGRLFPRFGLPLHLDPED